MAFIRSQSIFHLKIFKRKKIKQFDCAINNCNQRMNEECLKRRECLFQCIGVCISSQLILPFFKRISSHSKKIDWNFFIAKKSEKRPWKWSMNVEQWYLREMGVYSSLRDFMFVSTQNDSKKCNRIAMHALYRPNGQIDRLSFIYAFIVLIADDIHNACELYIGFFI